MSFNRSMLALLALSALAGLPACSAASPATPVAAAPAFPFNAGAKWTYKAVVTGSDAQSVSGSAILELLKIEGQNAEFRLASQFGPVGERTTEFKGDIKQNPYSTAERIGLPTVDRITVPAGTFDVTKEVAKSPVQGGEETYEFWYNASNGLVKLVQTSVIGGKTVTSTYELQ